MKIAQQNERLVYQSSPESQNPVHVRSKSQNSTVIMNSSIMNNEILIKRNIGNLKDRFSGMDCVDVKQGNDSSSSLYIQMIKYMSKFSNKTEGWVMACIDESEESLKQKYVRFLVVKAWNKKDKIYKFYSTLLQRINKNGLDNTIITLKSLILIHNYLKKGIIQKQIIGPPEVMSDQKDIKPSDIINKVTNHWKNVIDGQIKQQLTLNKTENKDKFRSSYLSQLICDYGSLLSEKLKLSIFYKNYFEGNFSLNPFFNTPLKSFKPLNLGLVENLIKYWDKCICFSQNLFKENNLVKIQFGLGLSIMDEIYCLLSLVSHLWFAFKHSTNYIEGNPNTSSLSNKMNIIEDSFIRIYSLTVQFFNQCRSSQLFSSISNLVPILQLALLDTIIKVPILQQTRGDFNIFDFLNYNKSLAGIKLPLSYGETVGNIKIENDYMISLNTNQDQQYSTVTTESHDRIIPDALSQTSRPNRSNHQSKASEDLETIKKQPMATTKHSHESGNNRFSGKYSNLNQSPVSHHKQGQVENPFDLFDINDEFSHQTYSSDFKINQKLIPIDRQKNLKVFDFELSQQTNRSKEEDIQSKKPTKIDIKKQNTEKSSKKFGFQDIQSVEDDEGPGFNQRIPIYTSNYTNSKALTPRSTITKGDISPSTSPLSSQYKQSSIIGDNKDKFQYTINQSNNLRQHERSLTPTSNKISQIKQHAPSTLSKSPSQKNGPATHELLSQQQSNRLGSHSNYFPQNQQQQYTHSQNQQTQQQNQSNCQQQTHISKSPSQQLPTFYQPPQQRSPQPPQVQQQIIATQGFELHRFITQELNTSASEWIINVNQLIMDKQIGTGSSCDVFKGFWKQKEVAIKKMKIKSLNENHMKEFRREITALVKIKPQQNLVSLIGISQRQDELFIVTEFCAGGTLFDLLHRKKNLAMPWSIRIKIGHHVAQGMSYLHDLVPPIIHRDLKSLNLLLESAYDTTNLSKVIIKIADFGLARTQLENEQMTGVLGTFHWMAPEIFESKPYSTKADIYSFGIVLWEVCSRETPYKTFQTPHAIMKYVTFDRGRPDLNLIQEGCPINLKNLMVRCWDHDPGKRPNFQEVISTLRGIM